MAALAAIMPIDSFEVNVPIAAETGDIFMETPIAFAVDAEASVCEVTCGAGVVA